MNYQDNMSDVDPNIFINIGQILVSEEYLKNIAVENIPSTKSYEKYKEEYLNELNSQLYRLNKEKEEKLYDYERRLDINKKTIDKITQLNKKINLKNPQLKHHSNSTINFMSLQLKHLKECLAETIEEHTLNMQEICILEKDLPRLDFTIQKTKQFIMQYE
jgi:hypothetical protein